MPLACHGARRRRRCSDGRGSPTFFQPALVFFRQTSLIMRLMSTRLAIPPVLLLFALANSLMAGGPVICVEAQMWKTPGWQFGEADCGYVRVAPNPKAKFAIPDALKNVPGEPSSDFAR